MYNSISYECIYDHMSYVSFGHLFEIKNVLSICTIQKLDVLCYQSVARVIPEINKDKIRLS